jgi:phosphate transport system substrate-binding protein
VIQAVSAAEGGVGYVDASQVGDLGTVDVGAGEAFVPYSPEAAAAVVESSPRISGRPEGSLALKLARDTTATGSYPIVLVSYQLACTSYDDPSKTELVRAFLDHAVSQEGQAAAAAAAGSAPISDQLRADSSAVLDAIGR